MTFTCKRPAMVLLPVGDVYGWSWVPGPSPLNWAPVGLMSRLGPRFVEPLRLAVLELAQPMPSVLQLVG